jgi:hypothetical protein
MFTSMRLTRWQLIPLRVPKLLIDNRKSARYTCWTINEADRLVLPTQAGPGPPTFISERMKIVSHHSSARLHTIKSTNNQTITDALKRRAQSVINDKSVDAETRAIVRYGLEINDPCLPELLRRADAGETLVDNLTTFLRAVSNRTSTGWLTHRLKRSKANC